MPDPQRSAVMPADIVRFEHWLPNFAAQIARGGPVKIVAIGSSSTAGRGQVVPYPYRLQMALRDYYRKPDVEPMIDVINRGTGGQEARKEFDRFQKDVLDEHPALVIWQVGTNAIFHQADYNPDDVIAAIEKGLALLGGAATDVILMDPQFVPAIVRPDKIAASEEMVKRIAAAAAVAKTKVNVFRRFKLMQYWYEIDGNSFDRMTDPTDDDDRLHQSDWSTARVAWMLCKAITDATVPPE
jgi:hypothetical protein